MLYLVYILHDYVGHTAIRHIVRGSTEVLRKMPPPLPGVTLANKIQNYPLIEPRPRKKVLDTLMQILLSEEATSVSVFHIIQLL